MNEATMDLSIRLNGDRILYGAAEYSMEEFSTRILFYSSCVQCVCERVLNSYHVMVQPNAKHLYANRVIKQLVLLDSEMLCVVCALIFPQIFPDSKPFRNHIAILSWI